MTRKTSDALALDPVAVPGEAGEARWWDDGLAVIKSTARDTGGQVTILDQTIEARPGDYLLGPRHIPHRYTTGPDGCRMLFIFTPGGFEELLRAVSRPAQSRRLPAAGDRAPLSDEDLQRMQAAIQAHGCEMLE